MKAYILLAIALWVNSIAYTQQNNNKPNLEANKFSGSITIDGKLYEAAWKNASPIINLIEFRPTPFKPESSTNRTEAFLMYSNEGIYFGGKCYEQTKDSISRELVGRDGFGNNDFVGISFDTYNDKQNGFEYFLTPLGEQFDAKISTGNNDGEDFSWNAVWESKCIIENDGWLFEMFIPFSAIRFGKSKLQNWGLNIFRRRIKTAQTYSWSPINPQINGALTQEGIWNNLTDIKPPIRLQFSPYVSYYVTSFSKTEPGEKKSVMQFNGGMDVKYGINQAFTLDMALIPDFGQVQTDSRVLNLGPFQQQFNEVRPFFTEGTELFNKGDLFYSRKIGKEPVQVNNIYSNFDTSFKLIKDPRETQIVNATKISGRNQNGLAIGILNAVTIAQKATYVKKSTGIESKAETFPLTNYNVFVIDQTFKNNSSVSFVNTNVLRNGNDYDANVSMALINLNDKTNTWNIGGKAGLSKLIGAGPNKSTINGYTQSIYFGKTSGRFNFQITSDLTDNKFDKNDLGFQNNNNFFDNGFYFGYNWNKPKKWYNNMGVNINGYISRLLTPIDALKQKGHMLQEQFYAANFYGQTKKLWQWYSNFNIRTDGNDYYEARKAGQVFKRAGRLNWYVNISSNEAKKYSISPEFAIRRNGQFKNAVGYILGMSQKIRLNQQFSVEHLISYDKGKNQVGYTARLNGDTYFARRNTNTVQNRLNLKYNFTNKMGLTLNIRHYWSGVNPKELLLLNNLGSLVAPIASIPAASNYNQNYNQFALNMVYTWQIANGSFLNIVWKDEAEEFVRNEFESNYLKNISKSFNVNNANTISVKLIYFLDYLTLKRKKK
jgi:hypothetical protein